MRLTNLDYADGFVFANAELARASYQKIFSETELTGGPEVWRLSFGGRVLVYLDFGSFTTYTKRWSWPILPIIRVEQMLEVVDCFLTGTAYDVLWNGRARHLVGAETNPNKGRLSHRIVWANRTEGRYVTDPLYRQVFCGPDEIAKYLEKRNEVHSPRI